MQRAIQGGLGENAPESEVGGVRLDGKGQIWLKVLQNGCRCERLLQCPKGLVCLVGLGGLHAFASERGKWGSEGGIVQDDFFVEVGKAQK